MLGVAIWLVVVGGLDLLRAHDDETSRARRLWLSGLGIWLTVGVAAWALLGEGRADPTIGGVAGWAAVAVSLTGWILCSGSALGRARRLPPGASLRPWAPRFVGAFASLAVGLVGAVAAGDRMGSLRAFDEVVRGSALSGFAASQVLLVLGILLVQVSTANIVVRLVLDLVGVPAHDNEKQLRGGRVLGPMERVFLVGLGLAGSLTAASVVIAAKALLRFPELRTPRAGETGAGGPSDVTEYFLVGSMASWLFALGSVALAAL